MASNAGRALAREGQAIYAEIGRTLDIVEMTGGATDAGFANRSSKAVGRKFGLAGFGYHAREECIDTGSIVPRLSDDADADGTGEEEVRVAAARSPVCSEAEYGFDDTYVDANPGFRFAASRLRSLNTRNWFAPMRIAH